jgi:formylmethanofuran dehydrogenase subunit C
MPLHLHYKQSRAVPVEVEGLLPEWVREKSLAEIERLEVFHGNEQLPLAELFSVSGDPSDLEMQFSGDLSGVHWIGTKLTAGTIRVEGPAGRHVGSEMSGGKIHVHGDAGDWVGGEMRGGLIHIHGRAGNLIGSAYRGSKRGMTGGTILVDGAVGDEIGHTMRRGLIAVGGCGDFAGLNMIAGTILIFGPAGLRTGAGMRRGTIGLLARQTPQLLPTFRRGGSDKLLVVKLLLRELQSHGYAFDESLLEASYQMFHGDEVTVGRGEVLLPVHA